LRKFNLVCCGGTFDILHKGHEELLRRAFEVGDCVIIGLTTDDFVKELKKNHGSNPYSIRLKNLKNFLKKKGWIKRAKIVPLSDYGGPALFRGDIEAIIVSSETEKRAVEINRERIRKGLKPLEIVVVKMVLAEDGKPISVTRIRKGEIDRNGRILKRRL